MVHAKSETTSTKKLLRHLETNKSTARDLLKKQRQCYSFRHLETDKYCKGALLKNLDDVILLLDIKMINNDV